MDVGEFIAALIEQREMVSDWLKGTAIEAVTKAIGRSQAIALAKWDDDGEEKFGFLAVEGGNWTLVEVADVLNDDTTGLIAEVVTTRLGALDHVTVEDRERFVTAPDARTPVRAEVEEIRLFHDHFPDGEVRIDLTHGDLREYRQEIVARFRAIGGA
jgi:hypothetical protein